MVQVPTGWNSAWTLKHKSLKINKKQYSWFYKELQHSYHYSYLCIFTTSMVSLFKMHIYLLLANGSFFNWRNDLLGMSVLCLHYCTKQMNRCSFRSVGPPLGSGGRIYSNRYIWLVWNVPEELFGFRDTISQTPVHTHTMKQLRQSLLRHRCSFNFVSIFFELKHWIANIVVYCKVLISNETQPIPYPLNHHISNCLQSQRL